MREYVGYIYEGLFKPLMVVLHDFDNYSSTNWVPLVRTTNKAIF